MSRLARFGVLALGLVACDGEIGDPIGGEPASASELGGAGGCAPSDPVCVDGCTSAECVCGAGGTLCGSGCTVLDSDPDNCGDCGHACPEGAACVAGHCACPEGKTSCSGFCVDVYDDLLHCGGCASACAQDQICDLGECAAKDSMTCRASCGAGRVCVAGQCVCPEGSAACEGTCVDLQRDVEHCGGCTMACMDTALCTSGSCVCPDNQTVCDGSCVDPDLNPDHCGGCGQRCYAGEVCTGGRCEGPLGADGCSGAARDVTMTEIAAYQAVKISLMKDGAPVEPSARVADVVQGRTALFRVFVKLAPGFAPRELSARLTLHNGESMNQYFGKRVVNQDSSDAQTTSTFQIFVPGDKIDTDTRYSVELAECAGGSGAIVAPRFPETGEAMLGVRLTGPLKVRVVPVQANSRLPDTSETALGVYREYLRAMFPVDDVELELTSSISTPHPINWTNLLEQVRTKRQNDKPPADVYYYGLVKPTDTFRQACGTSCTIGIGYVASANGASARVAVGLAFGDESSASTMAHEIGHNHGRDHAPCAPGGNISGVDRNYPHAGAVIGVWGYDSRKQVLFGPTQATDIMGYCNTKWISDYTYRGLTERVVRVNGSQYVYVAPEQIARYRVLILDADGPRWSLPFPRPEAPHGSPEQAEVLDATGAVLTRVTVYRTLVSDIGAAVVLVPEPKKSWHAVRVPGWPALAFRSR